MKLVSRERSSLRTFRSILLNSHDHNCFFGHIKKLILPSNNSIKVRINNIENDDPAFVSVALNESFASNFSSNIYIPHGIIANLIPSFTGFPLSCYDFVLLLFLYW